MGICSKRYFMLSVCILQMLTVIQRQVFDFLGFLWIPILINFFEVIFIIFGFFGAFQYRPKYIISYSIWNLFWLGWNIFLICLYLDIGNLDHKESKVLKLDPDSGSWWRNGPGCKATLNTTSPVPTLDNYNCLIDYRFVEIFQAGIQSLLAVLGVISGLCLSKLFIEEDDSSSRKIAQKKTKRRSLYSIEFSSQYEGRQGDSDSPDYDQEQVPPHPVSPKPMTPRRVKRRNVMQRGSSGRYSTSSRRHSGNRSSTRSSRRTVQNPVTRLLEQQQKVQAYDSPASQSPTEALPSYFSVSNNNLWKNNGHSNPTYQQSSVQSLNETDDFEELYNNRPASVRSSYSNFHGTRILSQHQHHQQHQQHQQYNNHATPQVPQKRNHPQRQSLRSKVFLSNGPPAYNAHSPLDSETTI